MSNRGDSSVAKMREATYVRSVLIVDDDEPFLRSAHRALRDHGAVHTTTCAARARSLSIEEDPDLVIVDVQLEGSSGLDLIRELKEVLPDLSVVAYTVHLTAEVLSGALRAGAMFAAAKPRPLREIVRQVEKNTSSSEHLPTLSLTELHPRNRGPRWTKARTAMANAEDSAVRERLRRALLALDDLDDESDLDAALKLVVELASVHLGQVDDELARQLARLRHILVSRKRGRRTLDEEISALEDRRVREAMERHDGNVTEVARELGVARGYVYKLLRRIS